MGRGIGHHHAHHAIVANEADAFHAAGVASHGTHVGLAETDRHAVGRREHHLVARLGHDHVDHFVSFAELDSDDPGAQRAAIGGQIGLLHQSPRGGHNEVMVRQVEIAHRAAVGDLLALAQVEQIDHGPAAAVASQLRQFVDLAPIDPAAVGEEHQVIVGAGHE